ncbi:MAG: DUF1972 domain-containing protein [Saprospiraceae bacterium]|nr:DUF1972 domain-containing protein [Saprospiraceae bacterium]
MRQKKKIRLGILGSRGIPNRYGGYEQFAQYLSVGLVQRGHEVWVYNSSLHPFKEDSYQGVDLIHCFDPEDRLGSFGQFVYDFNCLRDARSRPFDILFQLGYTSSAIWYPWWPKKMIQVMHMDGLEWKRSKYSKRVQHFLKRMERIAANRADALIADSTAIEDYLQQTYQKPSTFIPYGAQSEINPSLEHLEQYQLEAGAYVLAIARFVPENHIEEIIQGVIASKYEGPLVIVGNPEQAYGKYLRARYPSDQVHYLGGIYDFEQLNSLRSYAQLYFHGHSVGGTNPSLLEAMACEVPICAHDNVFNRSVLAENAHYFLDSSSISRLLDKIGEQDVTQWVKGNKERMLSRYRWEGIIDSYEKLFLDLLDQPSS